MVYCTPLCGVPWAPESCLGTQHCMGLPCPSTENGKAYSSASKDIKCISFTEVICVNRVDQINNPDWEGGERHGIYLPQEGEGLSCESVADKTMVCPPPSPRVEMGWQAPLMVCPVKVNPISHALVSP